MSSGKGTAAYDLWDALLLTAGADEQTAEGYWNRACAGAQWRAVFLRSERRSLLEIVAIDQLTDREDRRAAIR
jgi:hypothetical protein